MNSVEVETQLDQGDVICTVSVRGDHPLSPGSGIVWIDIWEMRLPVGNAYTQEQLHGVLQGISHSADQLVAIVATEPPEKLDEYIAARIRKKEPLFFGELVFQ